MKTIVRAAVCGHLVRFVSAGDTVRTVNLCPRCIARTRPAPATATLRTWDEEHLGVPATKRAAILTR